MFCNENSEEEQKQNLLKVIDYLIENGADVYSYINIKDPNILLPSKNNNQNSNNLIKSPLILSILSKSSELLEILLKKKIPLNKPLPNNKLPFKFAMENNCPIDILEILFSKGSQINLIDNEGKSLLHFAAELQNIDYINFLINKNIDPLILDQNNCTALFYSAKNNNKEICEILIKNGCDPLFQNKKKRTPLAVTNQECAKFMIELLNNLEIKNKINESNKLINEKLNKSLKPLLKNLELNNNPKSIKKVLINTQKISKNNKNFDTPQARPWGGSIEAELFKRDVRLNLLSLKKDMNSQIEELKNEIENLQNSLTNEK